MNFTGRLTTRGQALLAKVLNGGTVTVTKVLAGAGTTAQDAPVLADAKQTLAISARSTDGPVATLTVTLAASLAEGAYTLTELGVYAQDPDAGEILYQVYRLDEPVEIAPTSRLVLRTYLRLAASDGLALSLALPPSGLLVEEDLPPLLDDWLRPQYIDVYVAKTGSDTTGDGDQARPFLTIQKAIDTFPRIQSGRVRIHIGPGQYEEDLTLHSLPGTVSVNLDAPDGDVHIKSVYLSGCSAYIGLIGLDIYGSMSGSYHPSIYAESCRYVHLDRITCAGVPEGPENLAAITASWGTTLFVWNTTISNKPVALDCMGSTVYLNNGITGENNTVAIRCGTGFGSFGGIVFKGGATIAGAEQTAYGGQIFD